MANSFKVDVKGTKELANFLKKNKDLTPVKRIVAKHGASLKKQTQQNMNNLYKGHYEWKKGAGLTMVSPTGNTRRSVTNTISNGGLTATVAPQTEYFPYLEYGTRFMAARPTLHPAFAIESMKFANDLNKLFK